MLNTSNGAAVSRATELARGIEALVRPRTVAIIGMSSKPGSAGQVVLNNLVAAGYSGVIYPVGRSGGEIAGRRVLTSIAELPDGIDLAILMVPAEALKDSLMQCVDRKVRSAVSFASGFAEMGAAGRAQQEELAQIAKNANMAFLGPNTVGYFNFVDSFHVMMIDLKAAPQLARDSGPALAIVAQSGGIGAHISFSLQARSVPISYMLTTGNEAHLNLSDVVAFLADDARTSVIVVYAEQILSPSSFLHAAQKAQERGKRIVLLHSGTSEKGKAATSSHTGALAGNLAAMKLAAQQAGVAVVETLEELMDVGQLLLRSRSPVAGGLGVLTASGALCALTEDYIEDLAFDIPALAADTVARLRPALPEFLMVRNPLDIGTLIAWKPELVGIAAGALLSDPAVGSLVLSLPFADPDMAMGWIKSYLAAREDCKKPTIYVIHGEDRPLSAALLQFAKDHGIVLMRSHERAVRALARLAQCYEQWTRPVCDEVPVVYPGLPKLGSGTQPEWLGKQVLAAMGIKTPAGALARDCEEATTIATRIGFPVVLKAQAAALSHKSEAGGVVLNLADEDAVRAAWSSIEANVHRAQPGLSLEGMLVERMSPRGVELVVGASRDAKWGPTIMVGLGGIWVEALADVRMLAPNLQHAAIIKEVLRLKAHRVLEGFRGQEAVDLEAVAAAIHAVGRLMLTQPEIIELDINPLVAFPKGRGVLALDALVVTRSSS
ncbi:MAG TPA: acetate--CoA ligase family protein [Steroidobacteraceae bacterium]|nr:acetate--CoA ligase family protein [Steroidobacteraceae bacterium]